MIFSKICYVVQHSYSQMGNRRILEACRITIYQCQHCPFSARSGKEIIFLAHYKSHYAFRRPPTILTEQNCDTLLDLDSGESDDEHLDVGKSRFSCIFCSDEFQDLENVRSHLMKVSIKSIYNEKMLNFLINRSMVACRLKVVFAKTIPLL